MKFTFPLLITTMVLFHSCSSNQTPANPTPSPTPPPTTTPTPPPSTTPSITDDLKEVDAYYRMSELNIKRSDSHKTDSCQVKTDNFAEAINFAVDYHMSAYKNHVQRLAPYYYVPSDLNSHVATSLIEHPLCENFTSSTLKDVIIKVPSSATIKKMNEFTKLSNSYRRSDKKKFSKLWKKFMGCLAYTESLTTANTSRSYEVAKKFNYSKPKGVKFYDDPHQSEASRYNIGLFQFTPTASGNVNPCLRNWSYQFPNCKMSTTSSQSELVKTFGSSGQVFNAYCGVNKIVGSFAIQQNSTSAKRIYKTEESKSKGKRCVMPFFQSGWAYNHFGPLQNSTGKNLDSLLTCVLK